MRAASRPLSESVAGLAPDLSNLDAVSEASSTLSSIKDALRTQLTRSPAKMPSPAKSAASAPAPASPQSSETRRASSSTIESDVKHRPRRRRRSSDGSECCECGRRRASRANTRPVELNDDDTAGVRAGAAQSVKIDAPDGPRTDESRDAASIPRESPLDLVTVVFALIFLPLTIPMRVVCSLPFASRAVPLAWRPFPVADLVHALLRLLMSPLNAVVHLLLSGLKWDVNVSVNTNGKTESDAQTRAPASAPSNAPS